MTNPDFEIDSSLVDLARRWPTYPTTAIHIYLRAVSGGPGAGGYERVEQETAVRRCCLCHEEIYAAQAGQQILAHLLRSHGYRMDGRAWNNRNELVGHA